VLTFVPPSQLLERVSSLEAGASQLTMEVTALRQELELRPPATNPQTQQADSTLSQVSL
jgi:hypothetical protein